ncbi:hypothetical protein GCM10007079_37890 [Nocardiopsis terrae]|uniref:Uncharacterized protein n=1 Tax=Nocardiopsis terrae TaxID=372655 RepID=A0ABR9HDT3_9ACTN|nr:hypothetical protein [Nocardiopsis terrae]MBE1457177.1 hypothetical protein [Nocardiopsis terrae]GHC91017.1 hypothetical protein GCM10007079_37890 [Nocardiopsis terrae]
MERSRVPAAWVYLLVSLSLLVVGASFSPLDSEEAARAGRQDVELTKSGLQNFTLLTAMVAALLLASMRTGVFYVSLGAALAAAALSLLLAL